MNVFSKRSSDHQAAHFEGKLSELSRQNQAKDQEIARLRQVLKSHISEAESLPKLRKEFGAKVDELKDLIGSTTQAALSIENRALVEEIQALTEGKRSLQVVLKSLEDELATAKKDRLHANETLRQLQESAFRGQDQPEWGTDTNESIADELDILFKDARTWCRNNCVRELPGFPGKSGEWPPDWEYVIRPHESILKHERLPLLLLHALLMDRIYRRIFAKPFFFLPWRRLKDEGQRKGSEEDELTQRYEFQLFLEHILEEILQGNPEGGHAWRSQLLRLLNPRSRGDKNERPQLEATKLRSDFAHEDAAKYIMEDFLMGSASTLIAKPSNEEKEGAELERIFRTAVRMANKLWLRRSSLQVQGLHELPQHFKIDQALLGYHSLHVKTLTDNPVALDGQLIRIVVQPAVLVRGKSDGSDYDEARILKAAVVWMG